MEIIGFIKPFSQCCFTIPIFGEGDDKYCQSLNNNLTIIGFDRIELPDADFVREYTWTGVIRIGDVGIAAFFIENVAVVVAPFSIATPLIKHLIKFVDPNINFYAIKEEVDSLRECMFDVRPLPAVESAYKALADFQINFGLEKEFFRAIGQLHLTAVLASDGRYNEAVTHAMDGYQQLAHKLNEGISKNPTILRKCMILLNIEVSKHLEKAERYFIPTEQLIIVGDDYLSIDFNKEDFAIPDTFTEDQHRPYYSNLLAMLITRESKKRRYRRFRWLPAAAVLLVLLVAGISLMRPTFMKSILGITAFDTKWLSFTGKQFILLSDGSKVYLNDGAELSYAWLESGSCEFRLKGEAFFNVTADSSRSFIIKTGSVDTEVLGTSFNVEAYENDVTVTVVRGIVFVNADGIREFVMADQSLFVSTQTMEFRKTYVDAKAITAWKNDFLTLNSVRLEDAAKIIGERYNVDVVFDTPSIKNCIITTVITEETDLQNVLILICMSTDLNYTIDASGDVHLSGRGCL